jgi:hypothetical protein
VCLSLSGNTINPDADDFIWAAQLFADGNFEEGAALAPSAFHSLLIAMAHIVISDWLVAAMFITISMSIFVLVPLYLITRELLGRKAAFWSCLLFAIAPVPNEASIEIIRAPGFLFFFGWGVYFSIKALREKKLYQFLLVGVFSLASILLRDEGVVLIIVFLAFVLFMALWKTGERKAMLKGLALWVAIPLFSVGFFFLVSGSEGEVVKTAGKIYGEVEDFVNLEFLDNYKRIYSQLKDLEAEAVFPKGKQNLAEIARHYMSVLYLIGLLQVLIKVLFPLYLIPLLLGFRKSMDRGGIFLLTLIFFYILMIYYRLIDRDFIQDRFLFAPAFLFYPWIGAGMEKMIVYVEKYARLKVSAAILIISFIMVPLYINTKIFCEPKSLIPEAGRWLKDHEEYNKYRLISTDSRIFFYADRKVECEIYEGDRHNYKKLQKYVLESGCEILAVRVSGSKKDTTPDLEFFTKIKEFRGSKDSVFFFLRKDLGEIGYEDGNLLVMTKIRARVLS